MFRLSYLFFEVGNYAIFFVKINEKSDSQFFGNTFADSSPVRAPGSGKLSASFPKNPEYQYHIYIYINIVFNRSYNKKLQGHFLYPCITQSCHQTYPITSIHPHRACNTRLCINLLFEPEGRLRYIMNILDKK